MPKVIGKSLPRIDGQAKVRGAALYPGDFNMSGQVFMKVLFANRPHALIRRVTTTAAQQAPGVLAVFTAKDVPVNEYGLVTPDQPVLCGPGSSNPAADRVRFIGDQVALVVAESEQQALAARDLIEVEYEDLPVVADALAALESSSPLVHPERGSNLFCHYRIRKGDVEEAFKAADVIIEGEYRTPAQEHAYLQPEAGLGYIDEQGRITVVVGGQWAHEDQEQIAHSLGLPKDRIRVIYPAIGGAFGGREDMSVQIILALAVYRLHEQGIDRPIKTIWSREESIIGHHKRHPYYFKTCWGAKKDGRLVAAEVRVVADGGAYAYTSTKVLGNATLMCTGPYKIPNVKVDSYAVYTNNIPNGAFRGFGGPQGAFAAESQMNKLAEALGMDPVEIRMINLLEDGDLLSVGTPLPKGVSIKKVLAQCAQRAGWVEDNGRWHRPGGMKLSSADQRKSVGVGVACAFKNVGFSFGSPENCWATIELRGSEHIEEAYLYHAGADVGQGSHTVFVQMAAEALQLPPQKIHLIASDTALTDNSGSVSASRMTFMAGNAIRGAAALALEKWKSEERPAVGVFQYRPPATTPYDPETGKSEPNFAYGYVAEAAEVEVDTETGELRIANIIVANDVGTAVNPKNVEGQVEGAVVQAVGYTVLENFVQKEARALTRTFSTYLIPTVLDVPERVDTLLLEYPDPIGPWGARGMGEMPYLCLAPTVTDALHSATGKWFDEFPLVPERVLKNLGTL